VVVLDIDVGNSRVKWRAHGPNGDLYGSVDRTDGHSSDRWPAVRPDRIRISSVASGKENDDLRSSLEHNFDCSPEFARPTRSLDGLICGYEEPSRLGVDRWLAMLAARRIAAGPFVVVDVGTAATIDFVSRDGRHEGGYIVPGLRLMTAALLHGTADVRVTFDPDNLETRPGRTTASAVGGGVVLMLADFVRGSIERFASDCANRPHVYLCGGDARMIAPLIGYRTRIEPNLVLDGLAIALP
jgi:type III pantothenate kinase